MKVAMEIDLIENQWFGHKIKGDLIFFLKSGIWGTVSKLFFKSK